MGSKCFGQRGLFTALFEYLNRSLRKSLSCSIAALEQQRLRSCLIHPRNATLVFQALIQRAGAIEVLVSFCKLAQTCKEKTFIVLHACLKTFMTNLFIVNTGSSEFY